MTVATCATPITSRSAASRYCVRSFSPIERESIYGRISAICNAAAAFLANERDRWQCDLRALAQQRLSALGVRQVYGEPRCTFAQPDAFYSYRRDGTTGRMAALIWLAP